MKKRKNRFLFKVFTTLLLGISCFNINMTNKDSIKTNAKGPSTMDEFTIAGFVNYYDFQTADLKTQTEDLARSGINWIDTPLWYVQRQDGSSVGRANPSIIDTPNGWKKFNDLCEELNIYFSMSSPNVSPTLANVEDLVKEAQGLDRCIGYYVKDEPSAAQFENVASVYNKLRELDPTRFAYVNLFPNYAGASNLGGSYEDYVYNWIKTIGKDNLEYLYFDHYPFTAFEDVRSSYFSDVETIRKAAFENGRIKTGGYTQMGWWNGMRRPTIAEARWSCNSLLAYGVKSISHFTWVSTRYVEPPAGEGMRDFVLTSDGEKTDLYEPMQKLNWQIRQLGKEIMKFDVAHAYHTGDIPTGTESLPNNFIIRPDSINDNLVLSLGYSNDDSDKYLMIFNKELSGNKKYKFNVDKTSGIESLTWFKPNDFETLPDYKKELEEAKQIEIDISNGSFEVELDAGEMRLYKLNGNVQIKEPLQAPRATLKSGNYIGEKYVELYNADENAEIYYTTDGSYPTYASKRYFEPIKVGNGREFGTYSIRAISIRGDEVSDVMTREYIITDGIENVSLGKPIKFTGNTEIFQGNTTAKSVNDGAFDPVNTFGSKDGEPCFAIVDFGEEYEINKVIAKAWHDWEFDDVIIQTALDENFTQGVHTIYNSDTDNSVGVGAGTDPLYIENPNGGHTFVFDPIKARYIRFYNVSARNATRKSIWEEIQAFTYKNEGTNLLSQSSWKVTGGGVWNIQDGVLKQTSEYDQSSWNRSYTYTAKKYKNFILEGNFAMNVDDPNAWGYVGFGIYKEEINNVQSDVDKGLYVAVEPRGRVLLWNGAKPELGPEDANIAGFGTRNEFNLKVISINDMITVSVNGTPVMHVRSDKLDRQAGYISIHGGLIPLSVSNVSIIELDDVSLPENIECLKTGGEYKVAVERYCSNKDLLDNLPGSIDATDTSGKTHQLKVKWNLDDFDSSITGFTTISGEYVDLPNNVVNYNNIKAKANVFVRSYVDTSVLTKLVDTAKSLNPNNYTVDSYKEVIIKLEAAEAILADPYLVQSDIGVANFQLYDAIYKYLVSVVDKSQLEQEIATASKFLENDNLLDSSKLLLTDAINNAKEIFDNILTTPEDVDQAVSQLQDLRANANYKVDVVSPSDKPEITIPEKEPTKKGCKGGVSGISGLFAALVGILAIKRKKK